MRVKKNLRVAVAFQGEPGAFSHAAAMKFLGPKVQILPCATFRDVFETLRTNKASSAVIPIENTLHGSVLENYDYLLQYGFPICGETSIRIAHQLIAIPGVAFRHLRHVYSHPVALNQCRRFFQVNRQLEAKTFYDTAGSVKMLIEERPEASAAIASAAAAQIYGGKILRRNIEDDARNFTRFFLLTKQTPKLRAKAGRWKTSVAFRTTNTPGALFRAMACLALRDLNLTKIESRPLPGRPWEYLFYVDLVGSAEDTAVRRALTNLAEITQFYKLLGSYQPIP